MAASSLTPEQRPGHFMLHWDTTNYPIALRPETDVTLGDLLGRLQPVLVGERDSAGQLDALALLRGVGTRLWQALMPDDAPAREQSINVYKG